MGKKTINPNDIRNESSILGPEWAPIYSLSTEATLEHFKDAMVNIIREPNLNSTVIMRADILKENVDGEMKGYDVPLDRQMCPLVINVEDTEPRFVTVGGGFKPVTVIVRRIVPRNPQRDSVINQTCLIYQRDDNAVAAIYVPHLDQAADIPYYLPPAQGVALVMHDGKISVHYSLFERSKLSEIPQLEDSERSLRIALRLLQTSSKHSMGRMEGYVKRVNHDVIVDKIAFQDTYTILKQKYAKKIMANWAESTDPKKHVFEDLAIASFLITLWGQMYYTKDDFEFMDLGCGNGLLVHILIQEGYKGAGIDARARKSWLTYPPEVQSHLHEQILVPKQLLDATAPELYDPGINVLDFPENTFIIGNHSDELTVWVPILGYPFMVIPCCSHSLNGARNRFPPKKNCENSTYASLVNHVVDVATEMGWKAEQERLRIPSTRNAAIIGRTRDVAKSLSIPDIIAKEGGADGWVEHSRKLRGSKPRAH